MKILKEKAGSNFFDISCSNFLLDMSLEARETKAKVNFWDLIKIKSFCTVKETINKTCLLYTSDAADDVSWV